MGDGSGGDVDEKCQQNKKRVVALQVVLLCPVFVSQGGYKGGEGGGVPSGKKITIDHKFKLNPRGK